MKITNEENVSKAIVSVVESDYKYKDKQFSATTIIQGIKSFLLAKRHSDDIVQDVADMGNLIFGLAVHHLLEMGQEKNTELKEGYLVSDIGNDGYKLSGRFDLYDEETRTLTDYKSCSVVKIKMKNFDDWHLQTMIYAWLLNKYDLPVEHLKIQFFAKDWKRSDYVLSCAKNEFYPSHEIGAVMWNFTKEDLDYIEKYLIERFKLIKDYENLPDDLIPNCTDEERFYRGDTFALHTYTKAGTPTKKAYRVFDTREEAEAFMANNPDTKFNLEIRKGEYIKCLNYCNANKFCNFYKELMEKKEVDEVCANSEN